MRTRVVVTQVMSAVSGYNVKVNGKTDWATGGHSENVRLDAWTMNVEFPYDINATGGWNEENGCTGNGSVSKGQTPKSTSAHKGDWDTADSATDWIKQVLLRMRSHHLFRETTECCVIKMILTRVSPCRW